MNEQTLKTNRYAAIDVAKLIAAVFIVAIHTGLFSDVSGLGFFVQNILTRFAVPFFFVASGFFLFGRMEYDTTHRLTKNNLAKLIRFEKRLLILYVVWSVVFLAWTIPNWYQLGWWGLSALKDYIVSFFFSGTLYHFWYILASLYGAVFCYFLLRYCKPALRFLILGGAWCLYLLAYSYGWITIPLLSDILNLFGKLSAVRTALLCAMPLMIIGGEIGHFQCKWSKKIRVGGFLLSAVLLITEILLLKTFSPNQSSFSYCIFTLPCALFLFLIVLHDIPVSSKLARYSPALRAYSTHMYCFHAFAFNFLHAWAPNLHNTWYFIIILCASLGVAIAIEWAHTKYRNRTSIKKESSCLN